MRVLAIGAGFDNKGAEAMLLTLAAFLRRRFPGCEVLHHAERSAWRPRMEEAGITALPDWPYVSKKVRIPEFWKDLLRLPLRRRHGLTEPCYGGITAALDISGFKSSDQFGTGAGRWWEIHQLKALGLPVIFLPQAWGPFRRLKVRLHARKVLEGSPLVFARDQESMEHLKALKVVPPDALKMGADVAFQFEPSSPELGAALLDEAGVRIDGRPLVGIAPSTRVYERAGGEGRDNAYLMFLEAACLRLLDGYGAQAIVIPHEIRGRTGRDDLHLARQLCEMPGLRNRLHAINRDCRAADLKALIGRLDFLLASRFHTLVAALSMRTPAFALGWSHKYEELMADAGVGDATAGIPQLNQDGLERLVTVFEKRDSLRGALVEHMPLVEESSRRALDLTARCVEQVAEMRIHAARA